MTTATTPMRVFDVKKGDKHIHIWLDGQPVEDYSDLAYMPCEPGIAADGWVAIRPEPLTTANENQREIKRGMVRWEKAQIVVGHDPYVPQDEPECHQ